MKPIEGKLAKQNGRIKMKPTRNIVTPNKNLWNSKRKVWYQKNDDEKEEKYSDWAERTIPIDKVESLRRGREMTEERNRELRRKIK